MKIIKLNDICDVRDGTHDSPQYVAEGYPLVTSKNIIDGQIDITNVSYISEEDYETINKRSNVDDGDILMPMIGTIGRPVIVNKEFEFAIKNVALIKFYKDSKVMPTYIRYILDSNLFKRYVDKENRGGTQKFISLGNIRNFPIPLVSLDKQKEITTTLNKLSQLIKNRKEQIELLDNLIKSRFIEMFGDPVENTMNWEMSKLGDLSIQINSGNTPKGGEQVYVDEGITFFRSQNVWKDRLEMEDIAFIDKETHENMKRSSLKHGDILMTKTGRINTENSSLGRAALYLGEDDAANVNGHVYFIRLKPDINNEFILKILVSKEYLEYIRSVCVGGIDKRQLNKNHIEDFPIICPPKDMQNNFIEFVHQVNKLKNEVQSALSETQKLFDSLMQKYFD